MARYFNGDKPQPHPIQSATSTAGCDRAALSPAAAAACVLCASSDLPCRKMAADDPGGASAPPLARRHQALVFLRLAPAALVTLLRVMPPVLSRDDLSHVPAELLPSHLLRWRWRDGARLARWRTADSFASFHETPPRLYRCHC